MKEELTLFATDVVARYVAQRCIKLSRIGKVATHKSCNINCGGQLDCSAIAPSKSKVFCCQIVGKGPCSCVGNKIWKKLS